jgi:glycosyltransferase involved in cell wall biosynthesis
VIAVSEDVSNSISKNISVNIPVCKIQNGVNTDYFCRDIQAGLELRRSLKIPEAAIVIGTIAVFRFQKRLDKWLEVFAVAASKNPNLFGIIVGAGPLKDEIELKITTLRLEGNVLLPGLETNVKPWLSAMDIFMMTSIFEGMPIALLEAMSMECTIVTTDAGGIKEVVVNNESGLMVPVEDWKELSGQISRLVSRPELRLELAKNARKRVLDNFGMKKMVQGLEELYDSYKTPSPKGQAAIREGDL